MISLSFAVRFIIHNDGYIYVPDSCDSGASCKLHVVLHGCVQNKNKVGNECAMHTGYSQWAESNNIIVLYPQVSLSATNQCLSLSRECRGEYAVWLSADKSVMCAEVYVVVLVLRSKNDAMLWRGNLLISMARMWVA